jgi:hypothetical protein
MRVDDDSEQLSGTMIHNIIDRRKRPHRWKLIDAIVEPTWHDNSVADSDKAEATQGEIDYEERKGLSVADAIAWAKAFPFPVTIYLYDEGEVGRSHPSNTSRPI